jgi:hypothetical protein
LSSSPSSTSTTRTDITRHAALYSTVYKESVQPITGVVNIEQVNSISSRSTALLPNCNPDLKNIYSKNSYKKDTVIITIL